MLPKRAGMVDRPVVLRVATKLDQFLPPISITKFDPANFRVYVEPRVKPKSVPFEDTVVERLRASSFLGISWQPGVIEHDPK
ncbi:MAG: hypothetical protein M3256_06655 [Actinomycetota bacterium]|nr:hypothetical protein [Actinomycetota bacterium]